jgi:uncharacterized protein (UPF0264 family)
MRLLVSVATAADARAAVEGGADFVDAKDPRSGPLGAVTVDRLREIHDTVAGARPVTAALGDAGDERAVEALARAYAASGAGLVKLGLLGTPSTSDAVRRVAAAVRGATESQAGVVVVAYADATSEIAPAPTAVIEIASRVGARGVLIDTVHKSGPGLLSLLSIDALTRWVAAARRAGLMVAVAGQLQGNDLTTVAGIGADVAGLRGAACTGGRGGSVSADLVRSLSRIVSTQSALARA